MLLWLFKVIQEIPTDLIVNAPYTDGELLQEISDLSQKDRSAQTKDGCETLMT